MFVDAMIHALRPRGSRIMPLPENGPVDSHPGTLFSQPVGKPCILQAIPRNLSPEHNISREAMDEVACAAATAQRRATANGDFADEIVPVSVPRRKKDPLIFDKDEHFRPGITMEALQKLPPAFIPKTGKVTAGNASGLNDGATGMVIMSADKAKELGPGAAIPASRPQARRAPAASGHGGSLRCRGQGSAGQKRHEAG
ncbi:MAG: hypothetical protein R2861_14005 [Desulfobacterales bacterium]